MNIRTVSAPLSLVKAWMLAALFACAISLGGLAGAGLAYADDATEVAGTPEPATTGGTLSGPDPTVAPAPKMAAVPSQEVNAETFGGIDEAQTYSFTFAEGSTVALIDPKTKKAAEGGVKTDQGEYKVKTSTKQESGGAKSVVAEVTFTPAKGFVGKAAAVTVRETTKDGTAVDHALTPTVVNNKKSIEKKQTISFVYSDGKKAADSVTRTATWELVGAVDPQTGEVAWPKPETATLEGFAVPSISGYKPSVDTIPQERVTPETWPPDTKVVYSPTSSTAAVPPTTRTTTTPGTATVTTIPTQAGTQATTQANTPTTANATDHAPTLGLSPSTWMSRSTPITYTITQRVSSDAQSMTINDTLEDVLEFASGVEGVRVTYSGGSASPEVSINGQTLTVNFPDVSGIRNGTVTVIFQAKVRDNVSLTNYRTSSSNIASIPNRVQTIFNNDGNRVLYSESKSVTVSLGGPGSGGGSTTVAGSATNTTTAAATGKALAATGDTPFGMLVVVAMSAAAFGGAILVRRRLDASVDSRVN